MKIVVNEAPSLKAAIEPIVSLVEEGLFELKKEEVTLKAMDPSQISMVSFSMPKTAFLEYNLPEETKMGINIGQLSSILSRGKKGEKAELSLEEGRLVIKFIADKKKRTFKVPLLNITAGPQREPKIEYTNQIKMHADSFKETLKDARLVSSHVRLLVNKESFTIEVKGENGDVKAEFESGSPEVAEIHSSSGAKATFQLQYLEDIVKASQGSSTLTINMETDRPLKLEYNVEGAKVVYYLAPRIEAD